MIILPDLLDQTPSIFGILDSPKSFIQSFQGRNGEPFKVLGVPGAPWEAMFQVVQDTALEPFGLAFGFGEKLWIKRCKTG